MYLLLNHLKDCGFPLKPADATDKDVFVHPANGVYAWKVPSTDELIEELGDKVTNISKEWKDGVIVWRASCGRIFGDWTMLAEEVEHYAYSSTPKEALIKLYIELHKDVTSGTN